MGAKFVSHLVSQLAFLISQVKSLSEVGMDSLNEMREILKNSILNWQSDKPYIRSHRYLSVVSGVHYNTIGKMANGDWSGRRPLHALKVMAVVAPEDVSRRFKDEYCPDASLVINSKLEGIRLNSRAEESDALKMLSRTDSNVAFVKCMYAGRSAKGFAGVDVEYVKMRRGHDGLLAIEKLVDNGLGYVENGRFFLNEKDVTYSSSIDLLEEIKMYINMYNYEAIGKTGNVNGEHRWSWSHEALKIIEGKFARLYCDLESMQKDGQYDGDYVLNVGFFANRVNLSDSETEDSETEE